MEDYLTSDVKHSHMQEIGKIRISDKEYPTLLKKIDNAPKILYVKGEIPTGKFLAIVGTRRYSQYGKRVTLEIANDLTEAGLGIISGMARGIDTFAHRACLDVGGKTIAVLGTGLDEKSIYPKENLKLAQEIIEKEGCLISELPPGGPGFKGNFPLRNRIISALSVGVLVVEAKKRSGALITARWAKKQNKKLFAVPGPVYSSNSWGPNYLIRRGARLVQSADDILNKLNLAPIKRKKMLGDSPEENLILGALKEESLHIEDIIKKTGLSAQKVCSILAMMEIKGKIKNLGRNTYALAR